jgi:hypothetical protein
VSDKGIKMWAKTVSKPGVNLQNKGVVIANFVINAAQSIEANGRKHRSKYIKIRAMTYHRVN